MCCNYTAHVLLECFKWAVIIQLMCCHQSIELQLYCICASKVLQLCFNYTFLCRIRFKALSSKYSDCIFIEKVSFSYNLSEKTKGQGSSATIIQFPITLAFSITAHKIQVLISFCIWYFCISFLFRVSLYFLQC